MSPFGLPVVDPDLCTACNDCVEACPLDLFMLVSLDAPLLVQCKNLFEGDAAEGVCSVACTGCGRCVQDAEEGLIQMSDGLAVVDYTEIELANPKAVERCPTGAIVWIEGRQFPEINLPAVHEVMA
jgi:ferredoxin